VAGWHGRPARERRRPGRPPRAIRRSVTARRAAGQASRVDGHGVLHPHRLPEPSAPRLHVGRAQDAVHAERQIWRVKRRGPTWRCLPSRAPWTESSGTQLTLTSSWCTSDLARRHDGAWRGVQRGTEGSASAAAGMAGGRHSPIEYESINIPTAAQAAQPSLSPDHAAAIIGRLTSADDRQGDRTAAGNGAGRRLLSRTFPGLATHSGRRKAGPCDW
jgi:hypothetical protein